MTHQRRPTDDHHLHELPPAPHVPTGSCNTVVIHCMLHMTMVDSSADGSPARTSTQVGVGVEREPDLSPTRDGVPAVSRGVDPGPLHNIRQGQAKHANFRDFCLDPP